MKKRKFIIISLCILLVIILFIYFIYFNKTKNEIIYKYKINNEEIFTTKKMEDGILLGEYKSNCKNKCELVISDYELTFYALKNAKEGYINDLLYKKVYNIGTFEDIRPVYIAKNEKDIIRLGFILTRKDKSNAYFNNNKGKITIPWTKEFEIDNLLINKEYLVAKDSKNFINIHTGKVHSIEKPFETYTCFTLNTCVFNNNNKSFIYNFDEEKIYDYDFKVLINYENGMVIEKDNKIYNLDLKTNKEIYLMDKPNLTYSNFCDYLHCPDDVDKNELLLNFYNKETCKSYIYNPLTNKLNTKECKIVE